MCNSKKYISYIGIIFEILVLTLVLNKIQLYSDDFYYKTFLKGDFENFINLNIEHYNVVNGRVLVHLLDEIMLNMNIYIYIVFIVLCLTYCFYFASKFVLNNTGSLSKETIIYSICLSCSLFLFIDIYVLKETVFWITGAFNYVYPITMTFLALSTIKNVLDKNKINLIQIFVIFIASATTEQGFIAIFLFTIGYSIINNIDKKIIFNRYEFVFIITEILGFLTIFLSPASRARATTSTTIFNSSLVKIIEKNFEIFSERIVGENGIYLIISFLLITISILSFKDRNLSKILSCGCLIGIAVVLGNTFSAISGVTAIVMTIIVFLYILISIFTFFKYKKYRNIALILLVIIMLQGATFLLGEVSYRSLYILSLLCVIIAANILTIIMVYFKKDILSIVLIILAIISGTIHMLPVINGYNHNKKIFDDMKQSIKDYDSNGFVEINVDIKNEYSHTMGYLNGDFYDYFLKNYGLKEIENDIYFVRNEESKIFVNNEQIKYPAWYDAGNILVPTRYVVEALDGECEWTKEDTIYYFDDYFVKLNNYSNKIIDCSNDEYIGIDLSQHMNNYMGRAYINIKALKYVINQYGYNIKIGSK